MAMELEDEIEDLEDLCRHHWVIESPNGPTSQGVCKFCGLERDFRNSLPGGGWERDASEVRARAVAAPRSPVL